jgi:hypothetical protein
MTQNLPTRPQRFPKGSATRAAERLFPVSTKYQTDPRAWVEERAREYIWEIQARILESIRDHKNTAIRSCHGSGKSHIVSRAICWWLDPNVHALGSAFAVTTAPSWPQIEAILWRYIRKLHTKMSLPGRVTLDCQWHMSDQRTQRYRVGDRTEELIAMGRKPADYDENALQGIHARYVLGVIDEANGVPKQLYDAMLAITTNDTSRVVAIGNPDDPGSHFAEITRPGTNWNVIDIPAFITPNISDRLAVELDLPPNDRLLRQRYNVIREDVPEDVKDELVSENWIRERAKDWGVGSPLWESRVMGRFPLITDDTLISPAMLEKSYQCHHPGLELGQYGVDIARYGQDKSSMYRNRGFQIRLHKEWGKRDTEESADIVENELRKHGPTRPPVNIDAIGVGSGVFDKLRRRGHNVRAIYGSESARNKRRFKNRRAEMYWTLRTLMDEGAIDLDPDDTSLAAQLGSIRWWEDSAGRIVVESKDDMRSRGLPSPDKADAVAMSILKHGSPKEVGKGRRFQEKKPLTHDFLTRKM